MTATGIIRIAIDARPLAAAPCGYTIYLSSIIHCLRKAGIELTLISNQSLQPHYEEAIGIETCIFGSSGQVIWEQRDLPDFLAKRRFDVYFSGANRGIPLRKAAQTRYVLGLLDVIPYLFFRDYFLKNWKARLRHPAMNAETLAQLVAVARADAILTISRQSAADIRRLFYRRDVTSCLIRLRDVESNAAMVPKRQFAYLGGVDFRKKVDVLLHGFAKFLSVHPGYRLFLIGSNYATIVPLINELGLCDNVVLTGFVDHKTKFRILGESQAMVYPSLYEGYGMAIAEGFQAQIPVLAAAGGSQAEVAGNGVRRIDPLSPDDITAAMTEMLDPATRQLWIERGQEQLARLTDPAVEHMVVDYFVRQAAMARG